MKDMLDRVIDIGDTIVYATRQSSSTDLTDATVIDVTLDKRGRPRIKVARLNRHPNLSFGIKNGMHRNWRSGVDEPVKPVWLHCPSQCYIVKKAGV